MKTDRGLPLLSHLLTLAIALATSSVALGSTGEDLYRAVQDGNSKRVAKLLRGGADARWATADRRWTSLHVAAQNGDQEIVQLLIEAGANVSAAESEGWTPLHLATYGGHFDVVESLLAAGASVNQETEGGSTAVDLAVPKHKEIATLLAASGGRGKKLGADLHNAAFEGRVDDVRDLLEWGAEVGYRSPESFSPLDVAAFAGQLECVRLLLAAGSEMAEQAEHGHTPLTLAAQEGHAEVVALLAESGVALDTLVTSGRTVTALNIAAAGGHTGVAAILLANGANPDGAEGVSDPPLLDAVSQGHTETAGVLIKGGAAINPETDWVPITALHLAVKTGDPAMVKLLLDSGARPEVFNMKKQTPLDVAVEAGHSEIAALLEAAARRRR